MATGVAVEGLSRRFTWGTAAPTSGTWQTGDEVHNIAAAAGTALLWRCVVAGSPGTWETIYGSTVSHLFARKPNDTQRGDTITKTADPDLQLAVVTNSVYLIECQLFYEATTAADIVMQWTMPSGAVIKTAAAALASNATVSTSASSRQMITTGNSTLGGIGSGSGLESRPAGILVTDATHAGTLAITWAAAATVGVAADAVIYANSYLHLTKVV